MSDTSPTPAAPPVAAPPVEAEPYTGPTAEDVSNMLVLIGNDADFVGPETWRPLFNKMKAEVEAAPTGAVLYIPNEW